MRILCLGQLVNVATGITGTILLLMIGEASQATWAVAVGTTANVLLSATLIPVFGADGAAVGTAAGVATTQVLMAYLLWRRRGIYSSVVRLRRATVR